MANAQMFVCMWIYTIFQILKEYLDKFKTHILLAFKVC